MLEGVFAGTDLVRTGLSATAFGMGFAFVLAGLLGLWRFPDFYTRLHAVSGSDLVGALLIVLGLIAAAPDAMAIGKLALLAIIIAAAQPSIAHFSANAAHAAGLAPLAGPYVAPRPGVGRKLVP